MPSFRNMIVDHESSYPIDDVEWNVLRDVLNISES